VVAFQASQLPNPVVEVAAAGHAPHRVKAEHTLKPVFADVPPGRFAALAPEAALTVRLLDRKAGSRDAVLGAATFAAGAAVGGPMRGRARSGRTPSGPRGAGPPRLSRRLPAHVAHLDSRPLTASPASGGPARETRLRSALPHGMALPATRSNACAPRSAPGGLGRACCGAPGGGAGFEGPLYVWLPLVPPRTALGWRARRTSSVVLEEGDGVPELQVGQPTVLRAAACAARCAASVLPAAT